MKLKDNGYLTTYVGVVILQYSPASTQWQTAQKTEGRNTMCNLYNLRKLKHSYKFV